MAITKTDVCNMALGRIGLVSLTDVDTDTTTPGIQARLHYEPTRDALFRSYRWRFAAARADLIKDEKTDSGTSTDDTNTTLKLYDTGQAWATNTYAGYYLYISGGTGLDQIRLIASNAATYITVSAAFTTTPDDTSTYEVWENYPPYPWGCQFDLPTDFIRLVSTYPERTPYVIEGTQLRTNSDSMHIAYVKAITSPTSWDSQFLDVMVLRLASKLCMPLVRDKVMKRQLDDEAAAAILQARATNVQEGDEFDYGASYTESRVSWTPED